MSQPNQGPSVETIYSTSVMYIDFMPMQRPANYVKNAAKMHTVRATRIIMNVMKYTQVRIMGRRRGTKRQFMIMKCIIIII